MLYNLSQKFIRNLAVIAHVDHGKTTLVNSILNQMGTAKITSMDTLVLEQERGITILSKVTGIPYKSYFVNFVDTPGHADFGGQVERGMNIVDGVLLVVCATEGPMPQTRYVLQKAISAGLKPIVVMNKLDRPTAKPGEVEGRIFDLFCSLDVKEDQLDYPLLYSSGRAGWVDLNLNGPRKGCEALLEKIISYIPHPTEKEAGPFKMLISMTETSSYYGKMMIGKVQQGQITVGDPVHILGDEKGPKAVGKITKIHKTIGQEKVDILKGIAGDIITIAGVNGSVNDTISHLDNKEFIAPIPIDMPTITLKIRVNDSPLNSMEGKKTSFQILRNRLFQEAENDLALRVKEGIGCVEVSGRGELHLGILIEQLRREDFELAIEAPIIVTKEENGQVLEPIEEVKIEVPSEFQSAITEQFLTRLAHFEDMKEISGTHTRLLFHTPTRTMMGFKPILLGITKGNMTIESHIFDYQPYKVPLTRRTSKVVIASSKAVCTEFGVTHLEEKGISFVSPGTQVYEGMLIGETQIDNEIILNPGKEKKLTNVRSVQKDEYYKLSEQKSFTVEEAIAYINEDELVEITPKNIRLRKKELNPSLRKKTQKILEL